jgi:hypothetical protein
MNRTQCRRAVSLAGWRIILPPTPLNLVTVLTAWGHGMSCSFGSGVNMYKTATVPLICRSVQLDIRCCRNVNKHALLRCLQKYKRLGNSPEGKGQGALAEFDLTERFVLNHWSSFQLIRLLPSVNVLDVYEIVSSF